MRERVKVLIAEDEYLVALDIRNELMRIGYDVCIPVATGDNVIAAAIKEKPDVILMDINLASDIDGIAAARAIRENYDPCIIFMTGLDEGGIKNIVGAMDKSRYIIKPVSIHEIEDMIRSVIGAVPGG
jgi:DNA-binding response OmpR family regulator